MPVISCTVLTPFGSQDSTTLWSPMRTEERVRVIIVRQSLWRATCARRRASRRRKQIWSAWRCSKMACNVVRISAAQLQSRNTTARILESDQWDMRSIAAFLSSRAIRYYKTCYWTAAANHVLFFNFKLCGISSSMNYSSHQDQISKWFMWLAILSFDVQMLRKLQYHLSFLTKSPVIWKQKFYIWHTSSDRVGRTVGLSEEHGAADCIPTGHGHSTILTASTSLSYFLAMANRFIILSLVTDTVQLAVMFILEAFSNRMILLMLKSSSVFGLSITLPYESPGLVRSGEIQCMLHEPQALRRELRGEHHECRGYSHIGKTHRWRRGSSGNKP